MNIFGPERLRDQGLVPDQEESGNRAIAALLSDSEVAEQTDLVATYRRGEDEAEGGERGAYEVWAARGMVRFQRLCRDDGSLDYRIVEQVGENPIGNQDPHALRSLAEEKAAARASGFDPEDPARRFIAPEQQSYPFAYERVAQLFDSPNAPDLVISPRDWCWGVELGIHGALHVRQARGPLWFCGPGVRVGRHELAARAVDIAPTCLAALGFPAIDGADASGRTSSERGVAPDVLLARQDGRILTEILDSAAKPPNRLYFFLIDGIHPTELEDRLENDPEALPNLRRLRAKAAVLASGSIVNFPSITWPSHTAIGTGSWCGHHDVVNPTYYLREKREFVSPQGQEINSEGFVSPRVEGLYEAFHRVRGEEVMTAGIHAPFGRGADHTVMEGRNLGDRERLKELTKQVSVDENPRWKADGHKTVVREAMVDGRGVAQVIELFTRDDLPPPSFVYHELLLTDGAGHDYGPHHEGLRQALDETDLRIGRVLDLLEEVGLFDETLFVVTSDHGMAPQDVAARRQSLPARGTDRHGREGGRADDLASRHGRQRRARRRRPHRPGDRLGGRRAGLGRAPGAGRRRGGGRAPRDGGGPGPRAGARAHWAGGRVRLRHALGRGLGAHRALGAAPGLQPAPAAAGRQAPGPRPSRGALRNVSWQFWIDRGGTFTDCIGIAPDGSLHTAKRLSSDDAPVEAIREILERSAAWAPGQPPPPCSVKLGTTVATNALLERRGARTLLVTNRGLGDLLEIGTQARPELFEFEIRKPSPLHERALELPGRLGPEGGEVEPLDEGMAREALAEARRAGLHSVACVGIHSYANPALEMRLVEIAREVGFPYAVASSEIAREMGMLARGETATTDAYLTPLLQAHVRALESALPNARLAFMQSSGGLTDARRFRGPGALLSGPAGGVVGAARVAAEAGYESAVGFDMGGTSTDVSLIEAGECERAFETTVAGVRVKAPMLRIHSVAAGGGSLCRFDGFRLSVGPESAGADPGPLCYGRAGTTRSSPPALRKGSAQRRDRAASEGLALTDVNLFLGRIQPERFPFPLQIGPVEAALAALERELRQAGHALDAEEIAAGLVEIANASMAQAIQEVSVGRGVDPRGCVLVGFGGAGGQHVCALARRLGIRTILLHPHAGLLSAFGIGIAELSWDGQRDAGRLQLGEAGDPPEAVEQALAALQIEGVSALEDEGIDRDRIAIDRILDLRYAGAETALAVAEPKTGDYADAFAAAHRARFGYTRPGRPIEITTARVRAHAPDPRVASTRTRAAEGGRAPLPRRRANVWFPEIGRRDVPVYDREVLRAADEIEGPAIVLESTGTVVLDPGFRARVDPRGVLVVEDTGAPPSRRELDLRAADPVRLEVFGNRFMSIAEQMGAVLRNTALSTNIKERLDYSCAVFDREGGLVANAPHIPVHLGAMGATVRAVLQAIPDLQPGDAIITNDPAEGGSHLPDVTVVTPVFLEGALHFFVASRGHHADLGGTTPGSMPADSRTLEEEGVVFRAFPLVRGGRLDEERVRRLLAEARHPARNPEDNLADFEAKVAANRAGERLLREMVEEQGLAAVETTMGQLQQAAAAKVAREIARLGDGDHVFEDHLDDSTPIRVSLQVRGERMRIDFAGTGAAVAGNLNAPRAVVESAVIYVLRCLVAERIPLNGGCLAPVEIAIPEGCLLDPPPGAAVVGGNVETSQRIVDVLLGAIGRVAASQGTMNNVAFGDDRFGYYETIGGGAGAGDGFDGASGVHTHMTNTRITDPEVMEARYPVRLERFALRSGSGGAGRFRGGDGLVRCYRFLAPLTVSLLTQRRETQPYGLSGGEPGAAGRNRLRRAAGGEEVVPGLARLRVEAGDLLIVETPGGGGFGKPILFEQRLAGPARGA